MRRHWPPRAALCEKAAECADRAIDTGGIDIQVRAKPSARPEQRKHAVGL
jgi:hypothetical protein